MKLKFLAKGFAPASYVIQGSIINGIDTSLFTEGSQFIGDEQTYNAGIYNMEYINGELHVTLGQMCKGYMVPGCCSDWTEGPWIDPSEYSPDIPFIIASNQWIIPRLESGEVEYWLDPSDNKWTIRYTEENP